WHATSKRLAWVVGRVDVDDREWAVPVHLHDGLGGCPSKVVHAGRHRDEAARLERLSLVRIELVTHSRMEASGHNSDVLGRRMMMRGDPVICGHFKAE